MPTTSYGPQSRRPVYSGTRRVAGLYERTLANCSSVFEAALRVNGQVIRRRLDATTKTDAMREVERLRVDWERGELHRSKVLSPTLAELADEYVANLRARLADTDPKRRRSPRTVADARYKLDRYILPTLGSVRASDLTAADVLRLLDRLAAFESKRGKQKRVSRLSLNTRTGILSTLPGLVRFGVKRGVVERNVVRDVAATTGPARSGSQNRATWMRQRSPGSFTNSATRSGLSPLPTFKGDCGRQRRSGSAGATSISRRELCVSRTSSEPTVSSTG